MLGDAPAARGAERVGDAACSSAVNKPFKISGASKLSEIKGIRDETSSDGTSSLACSGGPPPPVLQLAGPWTPTSFLFLSGKGDRPLGVECKLPALSGSLESGVLSARRMKSVTVAPKS